MKCQKCGLENVNTNTNCASCGNTLLAMPENQPAMNQPINNQPQTDSQNMFFAQNSETQNVAPQPTVIPIASGNGNMPKISKPFNKKLLIIPIVALVLLVLGVLSYFLFFSGNAPIGQIRPLNVALDKVSFKCGENVCEELNSKILSISIYDGKVNSKNVSHIALTSDGDVYALAAKNEAIKLEGDVNIKSVDSVFQISIGKNPLIKAGEIYYEVTADAKIKQIDPGFSKDVKQVVYYNTNYRIMIALSKDSKLAYYFPCDATNTKRDTYSAEQCKGKSETDWVKVEAMDNTYLSKPIKYAINAGFITEDNKLYTSQIAVSVDKATNKFHKTSGQDNPDPILDKVARYWGWTDGGDSYSFMVVQTEDNSAYYVEIGGYSDNDYKYKYDLKEKIVDAYYYNRTCFMIKTESKIYLSLYGYDENSKKIEGLKEYPELTKYKDNVRGMYRNGYEFYMLLSDGNLYKFYDTSPSYIRNRK